MEDFDVASAAVNAWLTPGHKTASSYGKHAEHLAIAELLKRGHRVAGAGQELQIDVQPVLLEDAGLFGHEHRQQVGGQRAAAYHDVRSAVAQRVQEVMAVAEGPDVVAATVLTAARAPKPKLRYPAGGLAARLKLLRLCRR